jgi:two-component system, LytTR family, response regulator
MIGINPKTDQAAIITKEMISAIEAKVTVPFLRIHRSFIINTDRVNRFSNETVEIGSKEIPVSRSYKKETLEVLNSIDI